MDRLVEAAQRESYFAIWSIKSSDGDGAARACAEVEVGGRPPRASAKAKKHEISASHSSSAAVGRVVVGIGERGPEPLKTGGVGRGCLGWGAWRRATCFPAREAFVSGTKVSALRPAGSAAQSRGARLLCHKTVDMRVRRQV